MTHPTDRGLRQLHQLSTPRAAVFAGLLGSKEFLVEDLPAKARDYVLRLEDLAGEDVSCIGVGLGREQTIVRRDILATK